MAPSIFMYFIQKFDPWKGSDKDTRKTLDLVQEENASTRANITFMSTQNTETLAFFSFPLEY